MTQVDLLKLRIASIYMRKVRFRKDLDGLGVLAEGTNLHGEVMYKSVEAPVTRVNFDRNVSIDR